MTFGQIFAIVAVIAIAFGYGWWRKNKNTPTIKAARDEIKAQVKEKIEDIKKG